MQDFIITSDGPKTSVIEHPCKHTSRRTTMFATGTCAQLNLLPIYHCHVHDLCSPFGNAKDEIIASCPTCDDFQTGEQP